MKDMSLLLGEVSKMLGDSGYRLWKHAELERYIKDGYSELCASTMCILRQKYINDAEGVGDYDLPDDFIAADRAVWDSLELEQFGEKCLQGMDGQYRNDEQTGDRPTGFFISEVGTIRKFRPPAESATDTDPVDLTTDSEQNFRLEYYAFGADLDSNPFELPDHYIHVIRHYVLWRAYKRPGPGYSRLLAKHYKARWEYDVALLTKIGASMESFHFKGIMGGSSSAGSRRPADPVLPWHYGRTVRG